MDTLESKFKNVASLSFSHNRNSVDVFGWNKEGKKILTIRNSNADNFLSYFEYGTTIYDPSGFNSSDDKDTMLSFLENC